MSVLPPDGTERSYKTKAVNSPSGAQVVWNEEHEFELGVAPCLILIARCPAPRACALRIVLCATRSCATCRAVRSKNSLLHNRLFAEGKSELKFEVYNKEFFGDDLIGEETVPFSDLWLPDGSPANKGELCVPVSKCVMAVPAGRTTHVRSRPMGRWMCVVAQACIIALLCLSTTQAS